MNGKLEKTKRKHGSRSKRLLLIFIMILKNRRNPRQILSRETVSVMRLVFTMKKRCAL